MSLGAASRAKGSGATFPMRYTAAFLAKVLQSYQELLDEIATGSAGAAARYEYYLLYDGHLELAGGGSRGAAREPSYFELVRLKADLDMAIDKLPKSLKLVADVVWRQGHDYRTAADLLGIAVGTVARRLRAARRKIISRILEQPQANSDSNNNGRER